MRSGMRIVVVALAAVLHVLPALAQQDPVTCEAFSSGFTTADGCLDGTQPTSGKKKKNQWSVDYDDDFWPDGWYGPGIGETF